MFSTIASALDLFKATTAMDISSSKVVSTDNARTTATKAKLGEQTTRDRIRDIYVGHFKRCNFTSFPPAYDQAFEDLVFQNAEKIGWDTKQMRSAIIVGANITSNTYRHITNIDTKVYIAIYTTLVVVVDDLTQKDPKVLKGVEEFIQRFRRVPHDIQFLQDLETHLVDGAGHFDPFAVDFNLWATLRFISGCYLEAVENSAQMQTKRPSEEYAYYLRNLTGVPEVYGMFMFPPSVPFTAYKDAIPIICDYLNFNNDLLSFYKEELDGEEDNMVSLLAQAQNVTKVDVLANLADKAGHAYERALTVIKDPDARKNFIAFAQGYIDFHTGSKRYRLYELGLGRPEWIN